MSSLGQVSPLGASPWERRSIRVAGNGKITPPFISLCGCVWKWLVPHCTQWFCWSLSLLNGYNWGYTPFSDISLCMIFPPEPYGLCGFHFAMFDSPGFTNQFTQTNSADGPAQVRSASHRQMRVGLFWASAARCRNTKLEFGVFWKLMCLSEGTTIVCLKPSDFTSLGSLFVPVHWCPPPNSEWLVATKWTSLIPNDS